MKKLFIIFLCIASQSIGTYAGGFDPRFPNTCISKEKINMDDVLLIENSNLSSAALENNGYSSISIERESITYHLGKKSKKVINVGSLIEKGSSLDFYLKFVLYQSDFYVLWRETYRNQSAKQGLLNFIDGELTEFCRGQYGFDYDD